MTAREVAVALMCSIALVALSSAAGADHASNFLEDVRDRFVALQTSLETVAERAAAGDLDGASESLQMARSLWADARDDVRDLAPRQAQLLRAFVDGMATAAEESNADDLIALARSAASTMDDVLEIFADYAEVGTTVEVESAELASGETTTLALFARDVPSGFAGFEVVVQFNPDAVRVDGSEMRTGRGATRIDAEAGTVSFNGVAVDVATQRAPPDVLALGTVQLTAIGDSGTEASLRTDIREIVDLDGNRLPALDRNGTVTIP